MVKRFYGGSGVSWNSIRVLRVCVNAYSILLYFVVSFAAIGSAQGGYMRVGQPLDAMHARACAFVVVWVRNWSNPYSGASGLLSMFSVKVETRWVSFI